MSCADADGGDTKVKITTSARTVAGRGLPPRHPKEANGHHGRLCLVYGVPSVVKEELTGDEVDALLKVITDAGGVECVSSCSEARGETTD